MNHSDRRSAKEALLASEARLRAIYEGTTIGLAFGDLDGHFVDANPALEQILGYSREELQRKTIPEITHPDDIAKDFALFQELMEGRLPHYQIEKRYFHKDGHVIWANIGISLVRDIEGHPQFPIAMIEDITERKRVELALVESQRFLHSTLSALTTHIAILDENGTIIAVNQAWRKFAESNQPLGSNVNEGANYLAVCDMARGPYAEEATAVAAGIRSVLRGKEQEFSIEYPCHSPNIRRWFVVRVTRFEGDGAVRIVVAHETITDRKLAQETLQISEQKYRRMFSEMASGAALHQMIYDSKGMPVDYVTLEVNAAFESLMNVAREEVVHRKASETLSTQELAHWLGIFGPVAKEGNSVRYAIHSPHNNKHFEGVAYSPESGKFVVIFSDVTGQKQTEEALRLSLEQLHGLGEKLEHLREEERKSISREVHDELGQILTALRLDLMKMRKSGKMSGQEFESKIQSTLALTDSAIKSVQDISARLRPGLLDDLGLIAAIEWQTEEFWKRTGVRCSLDLPSQEIVIDAERSTALFRILQEALTNVARHANARKVDVGLTEDARSVTLSVLDDGSGIPDSKIHHPGSIGLLGIRERLRPFGGELLLRRIAGGGTELRASLPQRYP